MSKYQMWLTYNDENEKLRFPVHPESLNIKMGSNNESVLISGLGEITIKQDAPAAEISFSSFFPANFFPGVEVDSLTNPEALANKIENWQYGEKPAHFIVTGTDINMYCTIESFTREETGGEVGSIHYSITLKEYREVTVRQVKVNVVTRKATIPATSTRTDNSTSGKTYTVVKGDCLWNIAKAKLGNATRWTEIYNLNKASIEATAKSRGLTSSSNGHWIFPGQVLTLP